MKWNPIVGGDLGDVPIFEDVLFTIIDEVTGKAYVIYDTIDPSLAKDGIVAFSEWALNRTEKVIAWADLPEPFKPTPDECFKCNHGHLQHDEDSDNWFECESLQRDVPPNGKPEDCPLNR